MIAALFAVFGSNSTPTGWRRRFEAVEGDHIGVMTGLFPTLRVKRHELALAGR
jgi:hypothetical protein